MTTTWQMFLGVAISTADAAGRLIERLRRDGPATFATERELVGYCDGAREAAKDVWARYCRWLGDTRRR
jgi:hypothetical protein